MVLRLNLQYQVGQCVDVVEGKHYLQKDSHFGKDFCESNVKKEEKDRPEVQN